MSRPVLLIEVGAGPLPAVTPVTRPAASWVPAIYQAPPIAPPTGVGTTPVTDGVLLQWDPIAGTGVVYIIDRSAAANGPWQEIARTTATRYLYSDGTNTAWYFRIRASINGQTGQGTTTAPAAPDLTTAQIKQEFQDAAERDQQLAQDLVDRTKALAEELQAQAEELQETANTLATQAQELANLQAALNATAYQADSAYPKGMLVKYDGGIYVAKVDVPAGHPPTQDAFWSYLGAYDSLAEAVGATAIAVSQAQAMVTELQGDLDILSSDVDGLRSQLAGKADASAVVALTTRVTDTENLLSTQSQSITNLQNALTGKADAAALSALTTRVTDAEGALESIGQSITNLQNSLAGKADSSALAALTTRLTDAEGELSSQGEDLTSLQNTVAGKADASAVSSLGTRVTAAENAITSQGQSVTSLQNAVANKADASAVTALTTRVTGAENSLSSQGQSITTLQNGLTGKADASAVNSLGTRVTATENAITSQSTALTSVKSQLGTSNNLALNPSFETGAEYWTKSLDQWGGATSFATAAGDGNWRPARTVGLQLFRDAGSNGYVTIQNGAVAATPGVAYIASVYAAIQGGVAAYCKLVFLDANFAEVSGGGDGNRVTNIGGQTLESYGRSFRRAVAPAGTRYMRIELWAQGDPAAQYIFAWYIRPMIEEARPDQTLPSPWVNNIAGMDSKYATATQSLSTRVTSVENGVASYQASWVLSLDVNGRIAGIKSVNNGTTSTIDFVFDKVRFLSSGSGARMELSDGNFRVYDANGVKRVAIGVNI